MIEWVDSNLEDLALALGLALVGIGTWAIYWPFACITIGTILLYMVLGPRR